MKHLAILGAGPGGYVAAIRAAIRPNTPPDAPFITPRLNVSFKWRTGRPEVVNRKDIPQDAAKSGKPNTFG